MEGEGFGGALVAEHVVLPVESFREPVAHEENGISLRELDDQPFIGEAGHRSEGHAGQGQSFDRRGGGVEPIDRRHAGRGEGQRAVLVATERQGHRQPAQVHPLEHSPRPGQSFNQVGARSESVKEALGRRHHRAGPKAVARGITHREGEHSVLREIEVVVVAADFGSGLHVRGDVETWNLGKASRQHGELQVTSFLQLRGLALVLGRQQLPLQFLPSSLALARQFLVRESLHLDQLQSELALGSSKSERKIDRHREQESDDREEGQQRLDDTGARQQAEVAEQAESETGAERENSCAKNRAARLAREERHDDDADHLETCRQHHEENVAERCRREEPGPDAEEHRDREQGAPVTRQRLVEDAVDEAQRKEPEQHAADVHGRLGKEHEAGVCDLPFVEQQEHECGSRYAQQGEEEVLLEAGVEDEQEEMKHGEGEEDAAEEAGVAPVAPRSAHLASRDRFAGSHSDDEAGGPTDALEPGGVRSGVANGEDVVARIQGPVHGVGLGGGHRFHRTGAEVAVATDELAVEIEIGSAMHLEVDRQGRLLEIGGDTEVKAKPADTCPALRQGSRAHRGFGGRPSGIIEVELGIVHPIARLVEPPRR